jgi:hypothetical protein
MAENKRQRGNGTDEADRQGTAGVDDDTGLGVDCRFLHVTAFGRSVLFVRIECHAMYCVWLCIISRLPLMCQENNGIPSPPREFFSS